MTTEERLGRLGHYLAGFDETFRKEREENRALWRETQQQIAIVTRRLADIEENFLRHQAEQAERDRVLDERFRQTDERIDKLVSAIGQFIASRQN